MEVSLSELKNTLFNIAAKYVSSEEAKYFADEMTEAYIRKYPDPDVLRDMVVTDAKRQEEHVGNSVKIVKDLPSLMKVDFNRLPLTFKLKWIHDTLIEKAKANGIAIFAFDNSGCIYALHTLTQGLAKRGYFAFASYNGGPLAVVPANGTRGLLGTNPISYAFPTKENNVVVDMATAEIPFYKLMDKKDSKQPLKPNVAVDSEGEMTTDPTKAYDETTSISNLLPIGGSYKGYLINYLFEILTGALIGSKMSDVQDISYVEEEHGGCIVAIDIAAFSPLETFKEDVSRLNEKISQQKPKKGERIIVPGETNWNKFIQANEKGFVFVDEKTWKELTRLAE